MQPVQVKLSPAEVRDSGKVRIGTMSPSFPAVRQTPANVADTGKVRTSNEDAAYAGGRLLAVADGVNVIEHAHAFQAPEKVQIRIVNVLNPIFGRADVCVQGFEAVQNARIAVHGRIIVQLHFLDDAVANRHAE